MNTLNDFSYERKDANRYSKIRGQARCVAKKREQKCTKCGYDKHVETCHIKAINSFPMDTPISIINSEENLILLCPNCHWEKDNLENKLKNQLKLICPECKQSKKWKTSLMCKKCANKNMKRWRKVERPSKEELEILIQKYPYVKLAQMFKISDTAIKKWCKSYGIKLENRLGYWQKQTRLKNYIR